MLIVDDDIRTVFALATVLEAHKLTQQLLANIRRWLEEDPHHPEQGGAGGRFTG
ncbi:hypothetical protein [Streptomyces murinus]|uniref:Uncharacterized protein n=1 Tax=Streptomyces murinus TaxID=33900 RepID=A0A7W3NJR1_STRMR|nr:hypothetical protein [Streptomyces murinus]MBA9051801.1 hypothetical protein [Streptomyces murinus]